MNHDSQDAPRPVDIAQITGRIRAEFDESPGLKLTEPQIRVLYSVDSEVSALILSVLCESGFLVKDAYGRYSKA